MNPHLKRHPPFPRGLLRSTELKVSDTSPGVAEQTEPPRPGGTSPPLSVAPARENNCSIKIQGAALHHRAGGRASGAERQASLPGQRKLFANSLRIVTSPGRGDSASIHGTEQLMRSDKAPLSQPAACFQQEKKEKALTGGGGVCLMARSGSFLEGRG